jgi:hypothetical protein
MITTLATNKKLLKKSLPPNTGANMNEWMKWMEVTNDHKTVVGISSLKRWDEMVSLEKWKIMVHNGQSPKNPIQYSTAPQLNAPPI